MAKKSYSLATIAAVVVHLAIAAVLVFSFTDKHLVISALTPADSEPVLEPKPEIETIDAVAIDESALNAEIARLEKIEQDKKRKERQRQEKIEKERKALAEQKKREQEQLAKLKEEKAKLEEQQKLDKIAEIERQAKLKLEKERLERLKKEQAQALKEKQEAEKAKKEAELAAKEAEKARQEAIEQARKKEEELQKKLAQEQKERERKLEQERQAKLEEEKRQRAKLQALVQSQIQQYAALVQSIIHQNWRQPLGVDLAGKKCVLSVQLSQNGDVLSAKVVESSGDKEFDRSSELAVMKSSPFPMPSEPEAQKQFRQFKFTFNPEAV